LVGVDKTGTYGDNPENPKLGVYFTTPELWKKLNVIVKQKHREPTIAEKKLWEFVRDRKVSGAKFRRQHTIERFIVDFICVDRRLIIEVDGEIHEYTRDEDAIRQVFLETEGFTVMRFSNTEVMDNIYAVLKQISNTIAHLHHPSPLGEGTG
jgi:very-short-patch-repair endonuclease